MKPHELVQRRICDAYGAPFDVPDFRDRVGIALQTLHLKPLHGMRITPAPGTTGWYLWAGEYSTDVDFFQPLCAEHLVNRCAMALPYLALPPGWRFLTDGEYVDVWHDPSLMRSS